MCAMIAQNLISSRKNNLYKFKFILLNGKTKNLIGITQIIFQCLCCNKYKKNNKNVAHNCAEIYLINIGLGMFQLFLAVSLTVSSNG